MPGLHNLAGARRSDGVRAPNKALTLARLLGSQKMFAQGGGAPVVVATNVYALLDASKKKKSKSKVRSETRTKPSV